MGILKPLSFNIMSGDLDPSGRSLQVLDTVHRSTLMNIERGKILAGEASFRNPAGIAGYNGFGADGRYYTNGVLGRTWTSRQSIDDFTDCVTDALRWIGIGNDFSEGGLGDVTSTPFGLRLYTSYTGPLAESFDRKGLMVRTTGSSVLAVLSSRVSVPQINAGLNLENCVLLGIQQVASDLDYVFVGVVRTGTHGDVIVSGECVGGIYTVTGSVPLPPGIVEVEVAIGINEVGSQYQGYYSLDPIAEDYTGATWSAIALPQALPAGWPSDAVPRLHAAFPAGYTPGFKHHISDVRVEENGGTWVGQQYASWWLETQDPSRPLDEGGVQAGCPDELFVSFNRDAQGRTELVLIDVDNPTTPFLWRRWPDFGIFKNKDFVTFPYEYWSPGWLDADEGHIVLTRHTSRWNTGGLNGGEKGEVWLVSLRWDKVLVFDIRGVGVYLSYYEEATGRVLRESSSLAGRRWKMLPTYTSETTGASYYDTFQIPQVPNNFVGTLRNGNLQEVKPAITYGVAIRRVSDGSICIGYGVQEVPYSPNYRGEYYVGLIRLDETSPIPQYDRWLCRKDEVGYNVWDESDESWVVVGISYDRALWWVQGGEDGAFDEIEGVLCRREWVSLLGTPNNPTTAPFIEDIFWRGKDVFEGCGLNLFVMDSDPVGSEVVIVASGWKGGSHLTCLWYDGVVPLNSVWKTFGTPYLPETSSHDLTHSIPSDEFPRWVSIFSNQDNDQLNLCRVSGAAAVGSDSYYPVDAGLWNMYVRFLGDTLRLSSHSMWRGIPIDHGDFVLELSGRFVPPFAAGYGFQALDAMSYNQLALFELGVIGEKFLGARIFLGLRGNLLGTGGFNVGADFRYMTGTGWAAHTGSCPVPSIMAVPGGAFRFRIKRSGKTWLLRFFNFELGTWHDLIEVQGLDVPVIPYMRCSAVDFMGLACGTSMEVEHFKLAPPDDEIGSPYYRDVSFSTISAMMGSVIGGAVVRESVPSIMSGSLICSEGWIFPGLLPRP